MEFNVYDKTLTRKDIILSPMSVVWFEEYSDIGNFQLVIPKTNENINRIEIGDFIGTTDSKTLMIITGIEDKDNALWFYGNESKGLLQDRIYDGKFVCKNVETSLREAIMEKRPLPIIRLGQYNGLTGELKSQKSYNSLFEMSKSLCDALDYGFTLVYNKDSKTLDYTIYQGQTQDILYSEKYGNISNVIKLNSVRNYKNVAYVAGQGQGEERIIIKVGDVDSVDFERRELYVDARDLQQEEMSDEEYKNVLISRGLERLAENSIIDNLTFEVDGEEYNKNFTLGDRLSCTLYEYHLKMTLRIISVKIVYENNTKKITIGLGNQIYRR